MKTFVCIALLAACALAAPAPEGKREKRWGLSPSIGFSSYSAPIISEGPIVYSEPAAIVHEPTIVSVRKIVSVPQVVSVKKIVSYPRVVSAPRLSYSYAPAYSAGWW